MPQLSRNFVVLKEELVGTFLEVYYTPSQVVTRGYCVAQSLNTFSVYTKGVTKRFMKNAFYISVDKSPVFGGWLIKKDVYGRASIY